VKVASFRIGGVDLRPEVLEVSEIGATLVLPFPRTRSSARPRPVDGDPVFLLASRETRGRLEPGPGAYYARLFLGTTDDADPQAQGLLGSGLHVVPLREDEVWGDEAQELFLKRAFGLRTVIAVDGARIPPAEGGREAATRFVASAGGELFDVSFRARPEGHDGLYAIDLQVTRQAHPESQLNDLDATLLVDNGRIVILGLPGRDPGLATPTMAFLALSARFDEFEDPTDGEEILLIEGEVEPPVVVERTSPEYPREARDLRVAGKVILQAVIRKDGSVDGVQVLRVPGVEGGEYLVEAATRAVRTWRYLPARVRGEPVNVYFTLVVDFTLR
jgi:TonB family protein